MRFTPRQLRILDRMRRGEGYKQISYKLGISVPNVKRSIEELCLREEINGPKHALALYVEYRCLVWQLAATRTEQHGTVLG